MTVKVIGIFYATATAFGQDPVGTVCYNSATETPSAHNEEGPSMHGMLVSGYAKPLVSYLIAALIAVSAFAMPAEAMLLPSAPQTQASAPGDRSVDLALLQRTLESRVLQQHLMDYGLTPEQAFERLSALPDEQVHQLASRIDALQAGGRGRHENEVLLIALIILLVLLIIIIVQHPAEADARA